MKVYVVGMRDAIPEGARLVVTTSHGPGWERGLSPFVCGPSTLPDGRVARNVENAWQFSKVYMEHADADGNPTEAWFEWSAKGFADVRAHRYPMGKGAIPRGSYVGTRTVGYVEARHLLYIPLYAKAVVRTASFERLRALAKSHPVALRDFDAYRHDLMGRTLKDVFNDPQRKAGHGFVLAGLLTGEIAPDGTLA